MKDETDPLPTAGEHVLRWDAIQDGDGWLAGERE
jgi:hypothetical protein